MIDPALFRETLGHYPTGVVVITAIDDTGSPVGMVVGSFTSVSLDPPLVAYLPTRTSGSYARLRTSRHFCVNVLAADQQELCARFASREPDKFAGVDWRPAGSGAPILAEAVGWIDCEVAQEVEGGDHMIVMGKVLDLAVERPTLPLLFFQGGYGRFALPSPVGSSDPELIEAAQMAEVVREPLERLAAEIGAVSSVMARVGDEAVFVAVSRADDEPGSPAVGHRVPLIPPVGTVFCAHASDEEVERWLDRAKASQEERVGFLASLAAVRDRGYSLTLVPRDPADRVARMSDYSGVDVTPLHERRVRQMIAESASLYEPVLDPGRTHDLHSVIVPVPTHEAQTRLAVRLSRLPRGASVPQIEEWAAALRTVAETSADRLRQRRCTTTRTNR
jgi:flavin reductase (DIM6/NTAB) family NADH-FMN oxidoreductase RutF/DNA-binding IclR family transcriptional regulator